MTYVLPLELLYRIYKSEIGDVIDEKYMKVSSTFQTDDDHSVNEGGYVQCKMTYEMAICHLTASQSYLARWEMKRAPTPESEDNVTYYYEPFIDDSMVNYEVNSLKRGVEGGSNYHASGELA